jgi:hypothetical protein
VSQTAAKADSAEARTIQDIVTARPWPAAVKGYELEFGEDSTGDPAVWIWLAIDDDVRPSAEKIQELGEFRRDVQSAILDAHLSRWPYVGFRARQHSES